MKSLLGCLCYDELMIYDIVKLISVVITAGKVYINATTLSEIGGCETMIWLHGSRFL